MKIYGNGFTMIDSNEYDLIQMMNEVDMKRIHTPEAQIKARRQAMKTFLVDASLIAAQIIRTAIISKAIRNQK